MKHNIKNLLILAIILLTTLGTFAQDKTTTTTIKETIAVNGNCGMCKKTIKKSLDVKGIKKANWDIDKKLLSVTYNSSKITNDEIQKLVAAAGYDTEKYKADDEVYKNLHGCCKYERK
jgi:copper chaperone CopZ